MAHGGRSRPADHDGAALIEIERLRGLALRDEVTGLANRRAFLEAMNAAFEGARAGGPIFSLTLLDLDGLKDINDTFGYQAGDHALRSFGGAIVAAVREGDLVARIGGDEFAVVAVHERPEQARQLRERLRELGRGVLNRLGSGGPQVMLSASIGQGVWTPASPSVESVFGVAEAELAAAKTALPPPLSAGAAFRPRGRRALGEELRSLLAMARQVTTTSGIGELLRRVSEQAAALIGAEIALIGLREPDGLVHVSEYWKVHTWIATTYRVAIHDGVLGRVVGAGEPMIVAAQHVGEYVALDLVQRLDLRSVLCVPLRDGGGTAFGALALANKRGAREFAVSDVGLAQAFADLAASAVESARGVAATEEARAYLRALMDQASDAIAVIAPETSRVVDANQAMAALSGYSYDELLALTAADLGLPSAVLLTPTVRGHLRGRDGELTPVEVSVSKVETGRGSRLFVIARDIRARLQADADREARARDLEARNAVSALLTEARPAPDGLQAALAMVANACDADGAALLLAEDSHIRYATGVNVPPALEQLLRERPATLGQRLTGSVAAGRTVAVIDDVATDPRIVWDLTRETGLRSMVLLPLIVDGRSLGLLAVASYTRARFDAPRVARLRAFADQVAVWLHGRTLLEEMHAREQDARFLADLGESLNERLDEQSILRRLVTQFARQFHCGAMAIMLDPATGNWRVTNTSNPDPERARALQQASRGWVWPPDDSRLVIARGGRPMLIDMASPPSELPPEALVIPRALGVSTLVAAPMAAGGETFGVLAVGSPQGGPRLGQRHLALVQQAAQHTAVAVANARAYHSADRHRAYLRAMMEQAGEAIVVLDAEGRITDANLRAESLLGSRETLIGIPLRDRIAPRDRRTLAATLAALDPYGPPAPARPTLRVRREGGPPSTVQVNASRVAGPDGPAVVLLLHDVTVERAAERHRERLLRRISEEAERSRLLVDLADRLTHADRPEAVMKLTVDACRGLTSVGRAMILLWDADQQRFLPGLSFGVTEAERQAMETLHLSVDLMPILGQVLHENQPVILLSRDLPADHAVVAALGVESVALLPLRASGTVLGCLCIDGKVRRRPFTRRDLDLLDGIARQAATALAAVAARSRAEEARDYLQAVMQHAGDGILVGDLDQGVLVDANERLCAMLNLTREEIIGRPLNDLAVPEERAASAAVLASITPETRYLPPSRRTLQGRDGLRVPVETTTGRISFGGRDLIVGIVRDQRRRIEVERQLSFHSQVLERMNDAVIAVDRDARITVWNRAAERLFGWPADQMVGRLFRDQVRPDLWPQFVDLFERLKTTEVVQGDVASVRDGGTPLTCHVTITRIRDDEGHAIGMIGLIRDVTEQRTGEARLRSFERMVTHAGEALLVVELDGAITYANPAAHHILGYAPGDLLGRNVTELVIGAGLPPNDRDTIIAALRGNVRFEAPARRANGGQVMLRGTLSGLQGPRGRASAVVVVAEDATAEHAARAEQAALLARLTAASETATRRTAELRTIADVAGALVAGGEPDDVLAALARRILESGAFDVATVSLVEPGAQMHVRLVEHRAGIRPAAMLARRGHRYHQSRLTLLNPAERLTGPVVCHLDDPEWQRGVSWSAARRDGMAMAVFAPLLYDGEFTGVLGLYARTPRVVPPDEIRLLQALADQVAAAVHNAANVGRIREMRRDAIFRLAIACEARDPETGQHLRQIQSITEALCRELGMDEADVEETSLAAVLHDIGKIAVPEAVLRKQGRFTPEEVTTVRKHTIWGAEMLSGPEFYERARQVARSHHERWDGGGYPDGLAGLVIPRPARIVAVADVFDALVSRRVYKPAWDIDTAAREILASSGSHFDPEVAAAFEALWHGGRLPAPGGPSAG